MSDTPATTAAVVDFLRRWEASGAAERANYQLFLSELCDLLAVPRPEPTRPDDRDNAYVFERSVTFRHGDGSTSTGRIDLYKRGHFVCEAKQGVGAIPAGRPYDHDATAGRVADSPLRYTPYPTKRGTAVRGTKGWDLAMLKAKGQAEQYARALPVGEGWPPFLVVVDVGHAIEIYSEFSCTGKSYLPFPDPRSHRVLLADLADEGVRERLRLVWSDPHLLDPGRHSAKVTRQVADRLAVLAKSLEQAGHSAGKVGNFLKRCLFTMFVEDVGLIPNSGFTSLLESLRGEADKFAPMAESLWGTMRDGGFSPVLREKLLRFNGGLFEEAEALLVSEEQLALLIAAGKADWRDVEPAIFGTLLERALGAEERHNLGAHYTPREYVERLVLPTVIEPLRSEWEAVLAAAVTLSGQGDGAGAIALVKGYHRKLCALRILDPACGSGNFLYVTFEHLKRLEGEVVNALEGFGEQQADLELAGLTVDPHQLLGIEVNPRAAAITDMVLWIGYLQWHFRTRGEVLPPEPVIRKFKNIECRDAVLAWDGTEPVIDADGTPVTRWDGRTTRTHPVTGEQVPDESARVPVLRYLNPRRAEWPEADFVVGNPPYLGARTIRPALGDGYLDALRQAYSDVPDNVDFVMYWWEKAAQLVTSGEIRQFGFITTKSISQEFCRKVILRHFAASDNFGIRFVIPNHPWVDTSDGADVRVAMTVCDNSGGTGRLSIVTSEAPSADGEIAVHLQTTIGMITPDLRIGVDLLAAEPLKANAGLSCVGYQLTGKGFVVSAEDARQIDSAFLTDASSVWPLVSGRDITQRSRNLFAIDVCGESPETLRRNKPGIFQWLFDRVKPERDHNNRAAVRDKWWVYGEARSLSDLGQKLKVSVASPE